MNIKKISASILLFGLSGTALAGTEQVDSFCKIEKGFQTYKSASNSKASGSTGNSSTFYDCVDDLQSVKVSGKDVQRQKIIIDGESVYVDSSAVMSKDILLQGEKVKARKGRLVYESPTSDSRLVRFTGKGLAVEYFKLVLDNDGEAIVENNKVKVLVVQHLGRSKWTKKIGWTPASGLSNRISDLNSNKTSSVAIQPPKLESKFICPANEGDQVIGYSLTTGKELAKFNKADEVKLATGKKVQKLEINGKDEFVFEVTTLKGNSYAVLEEQLEDSKADCNPAKSAATVVTTSTSDISEADKKEAERKNAEEEAAAAIKRVGLLDRVTCLTAGTVNVHKKVPGKGINSSPFEVNDNSRLKVFPDKPQSSELGGTTYKFIKVQVASNGKTGYIAERFVKTSSECSKKKDADKEAAAAAAPKRSSGEFFPLYHSPRASYKQMPRSYGAYRSYNGRKRSRAHAATDLYSWVGKTIRAVRAGSIIRGPYYFYSNTYAIEMKHDNGRVVRYGETLAKRVSSKNNVGAGANIAKVGRLSCCGPMLHFEMYQGNKRGALTVGRSASKFIRVGGKNLPSFRRNDLVNPTSYMDSLKRGL